MATLKDFTHSDVEVVADTLRPSDREYFQAMTGRDDPFWVMSGAFGTADQAKTAWTDDGDILIMCARSGNNVWFQSTKFSDGRGKETIRAGREMLSHLPKIAVFCVVPRDDKRVRLLCKALGFVTQTTEHPNYMGSGITHVVLWRSPDE